MTKKHIRLNRLGEGVCPECLVDLDDGCCPKCGTEWPLVGDSE